MVRYYLPGASNNARLILHYRTKSQDCTDTCTGMLWLLGVTNQLTEANLVTKSNNLPELCLIFRYGDWIKFEVRWKRAYQLR